MTNNSTKNAIFIALIYYYELTPKISITTSNPHVSRDRRIDFCSLVQSTDLYINLYAKLILILLYINFITSEQ